MMMMMMMMITYELSQCFLVRYNSVIVSGTILVIVSGRTTLHASVRCIDTGDLCVVVVRDSH